MIPNITLIDCDKRAGLAAYLSIWRTLSDQHFDVLLHLQASLRASFLTLGIKAKRRLGYHRSRAYEWQWLFTNEKTSCPKGMHVIDNYQAFADTLGCKVTPVRWPFELSDSALTYAQDLASRCVHPFVAICPAASKAYKNWYPEGYITVIQALQQLGYPVVLVGSPAKNELQMAEQIESMLSEPVINIVGQTTLEQLMAVLKYANLLITPDTGPAHMAAAMHTPVVGLYAHHNPARVGPYGFEQFAVNHWETLIRQQTGKEPEQLPWRCRVRDPEAMAQIRPEEVLAKIAEITEFRMLKHGADETNAESVRPSQSH
ncbi:glycosyltransferase family 9 protein [Celerinatantimonas sp. YJH-8]|uniref:glycosyltransferase family 9 protein n=1 Tax=Celerinatantimonas sp. YJH-8 TaxID=3228714 RepID=UPI0038CBF90E